jgi:uncharacterized membrane protein YhfC
VFIFQPIIVILISSGLVVYWHYRRSFRGILLLYTLVAYAGAIALKYAVQIPTVSSITAYFGAQSVGVGVYYGLQTVFFEVGLAFLVARYAVSHGQLGNKDAEAFGLGLGFWENAILLGLLSLINLVIYYLVLSSNTAIAQTLFNQLSKSAPALFSPPSQAVGSVAEGVVERISSILIHFSWGYLCVMAAYFRKRKYLMIALPMGFVDFLVPFAPSLTIIVFEAIVLAISIISVAVAWLVTSELRARSKRAS